MEGKEQAAKRALWGRVGYVGEAFAALDGTYEGVRIAPLNFMTQEDGGELAPARAHPAQFGNLAPLIMAALWEAAFVREACVPLSTWSN
jgi:hypothetical protein